MGTALGSIMATIMIPQATRKPTASTKSGIAGVAMLGWTINSTQAASATNTSSPPVISMVRSRATKVPANITLPARVMLPLPRYRARQPIHLRHAYLAGRRAYWRDDCAPKLVRAEKVLRDVPTRAGGCPCGELRGMKFSRFLDCLTSDFDRLRAVVPIEPMALVPSCPGWTVGDLTRHVGEVYLHKTMAMRDGVERQPWPPEELQQEEPIALLDRAYAGLVAEFASRNPDDPAGSWYTPNQTVGFWI